VFLVDVKFHDIGEGITEGEIVQYLVNIGDKVENDQPLVEVQTDKMTAELPSPATGVVKAIKAHEGETVSVGTTLLVIDAGETAASHTVAEEEIPDKIIERTKRQSEKKVSTPKWDTILAAPYTRKIARELGVDIELVRGTGPAGRVMDQDIYRYIDQLKTNNYRNEIQEKQEVSPQVSAEESALIPFKGRRKMIAQKMSQSAFTIPHVTHFEEVDVTNILHFIEELRRGGERISAAAFFIKAVQLALKEFPVFNAVLDEENEVIRLKKKYHIGIAADAKDGLIVPVIRNVEDKSIKEITDEMKKLTIKAQENNLSVKEITGGTFTVSNIGPLGSVAATPIINYPETALIAFHKAKKRPVVVDDEIVVRNMMNVSMSFDHRVADGGTAVEFTNHFAELIENPAKILLELV